MCWITVSVDASLHVWLCVFFLAGNTMMPQKTNGGTVVRLPDEHIHTLLGYNVASAQPSSAAKPESNILRSPHTAQAWPRPQMEITHHCNSFQPSVCSLSVCHVCLSRSECVCPHFCLYVCQYLSCCLAMNLSACLHVYFVIVSCLFVFVCLSAGVSHWMQKHCPAVLCISISLSVLQS